MTASLTLLLRLMHHLTETIVDLQMRTPGVFEPDQIRHTVNECIEQMLHAPELLLRTGPAHGLLKIKGQPFLCKRRLPYAIQHSQQSRFIQLSSQAGWIKQNQLCCCGLAITANRQRDLLKPEIQQNNICLCTGLL